MRYKMPLYLIVALAREFLGAEKTAMSILILLVVEQGLGEGWTRAVFSSGLMKMDMFLVDNQEKSGNWDGDLSSPAWKMK